MKLIFCVFIFLYFGEAESAPHPGVASSVLTDPSKGTFLHGFGFRIRGLPTEWTPHPLGSENGIESAVRLTSKQSTKDSSISIHLETMTKNSSLESYARKWMREYSGYGFEILGTKGVLLNGEKTLLVDLTQNRKNRQIRQAVLQRGSRIAVVTCLDKKDSFHLTLGICNEVLRGFQWIDPPSKSSTPQAN